jgi:hypothetical protein
MSPPLGCPSFQLKRSPFTPATVAVVLARFCIDVTFSRPTIASLDSSGISEYRPPGFGALMTCNTSGPCGVNCTCRVYVTPGISRLRSID